MKEYSFLIEDYNNHDDEDDEDLSTRFKGALAGLAATGGLQYASAYPLYKNMARIPGHEVSNLDYLKGVKVNGNIDVMDYLKDNNIDLKNLPHTAGPHYMPGTKGVKGTRYINLGLKNGEFAKKWGKAIFAHELGHSVSMAQNKNKEYTYYASKGISSLASLAQLLNCFNEDPRSRKKIAAIISSIGGMAALPMVAEEINASIKGSKMLGMKGKERAKAFIGVGSYITMALSPLIMYHVSEKSKKLLKFLFREKSSNPNINQKVEQLKHDDTPVNITS